MVLCESTGKRNACSPSIVVAVATTFALSVSAVSRVALVSVSICVARTRACLAEVCNRGWHLWCISGARFKDVDSVPDSWKCARCNPRLQHDRGGRRKGRAGRGRGRGKGRAGGQRTMALSCGSLAHLPARKYHSLLWKASPSARHSVPAATGVDGTTEALRGRLVLRPSGRGAILGVIGAFDVHSGCHKVRVEVCGFWCLSPMFRAFGTTAIVTCIAGAFQQWP